MLAGCTAGGAVAPRQLDVRWLTQQSSCAGVGRHSLHAANRCAGLACCRSNIAPQVGVGFNRDYWARFEHFCRGLAKQVGESEGS